MEAAPPAPQTEAPAKVPEPEDKASPTLAKPVSGTAAEMSGALPTGQAAEPNPVDTTGMHKPSLLIKTQLIPLPDSATINGTVEPAPEPPKEAQENTAAPEPEAPITGDTEMKEPDEGNNAQPEPNGTPAEKKSSSSASKRKTTSGVPEHKGKKLNKKKSISKITHLDAKPGEYYFARLKSYPPWPSIICDEDMLPEILLNTRPITTKKADGTYNEAYADGGKKEADRTFPVMFLHTNEL